MSFTQTRSLPLRNLSSTTICPGLSYTGISLSSLTQKSSLADDDDWHHVSRAFSEPGPALSSLYAFFSFSQSLKGVYFISFFFFSCKDKKMSTKNDFLSDKKNNELSLGKKVLKVEHLQDWWIYHLTPLRTWILVSLLNCLQCVTLSLGWPPSRSRDDYHNLRGCILHVNSQRNQRGPSFPCISFFLEPASAFCRKFLWYGMERGEDRC